MGSHNLCNGEVGVVYSRHSLLADDAHTDIASLNRGPLHWWARSECEPAGNRGKDRSRDEGARERRGGREEREERLNERRREAWRRGEERCMGGME